MITCVFAWVVATLISIAYERIALQEMPLRGLFLFLVCALVFWKLEASRAATAPSASLLFLACLIGGGVGVALSLSASVGIAADDGFTVAPLGNWKNVSIREVMAQSSMLLLWPLFEEIFLRAALLRLLLSHSRLWFAVMLQALVFVLIHFATVEVGVNDRSLQLFVAGLVLGLLYAVTGSLLAPLTAHIAWNTYVFLVPELFLETDVRTADGWLRSEFLTALSSSSLIAWLLVLFLLCVYLRRAQIATLSSYRPNI
jgi:membrane protease YdiL (CAAX protease family)